MRLAVIGATGLIGRAVVARALAEGHEVRALVRDPGALPAAPALSVVGGDARDLEVVRDLIAGAGAVVSAIGPDRNEPAAVALLESVAQSVVAAMRASGTSRVVFVAGAGVHLPGERVSLSQRLATWVVRRFARWIVLAKEREFAIYRESGLSWRAVRPVRVRPGPETGAERSSDASPGGLRVTSGDLAVVILRLAREDAPAGAAPFVWTAGRVPVTRAR